MLKNCLNCNKEFEGNRKTIFCSDECAEKYVDKESEPLKERTELVVTEKGLKEKPSAWITDKLRDLQKNINKDFGEGTLMFLSEKPLEKPDVVSTGSVLLDAALGVGGLPRGRIVEIYGWEGSGKTTITLHTIANAQKKDLTCLFVDAENSFDFERAASLGVDVDKLCLVQPEYGEQALEVADRAICSGAFGVVVIDSVAALVPKGELEGEMGDSKMGLQARLMSQALRKMIASVHKTNTLLIFINQLRDKIGIIYGNPATTTGGNALKFYSSVRMEVIKAAIIKDGEVSVGNKVKVKVIKNKCAPPMKTVEFDLIYGYGVDSVGEIVDLAVERGIIQKSGAWYSYEGSKVGQGRDAVKQLLTDTPTLFEEIKSKATQ